jgi:hypothetical protein
MVVPDKIAFVKFKISNTFKQNVDNTHSKQPKIQLVDFKNLKKKSASQKSRDFCRMFMISKKKTTP